MRGLRPVIGIPARKWDSPKGHPWPQHQGPTATILDSVIRGGGVPLIIPINENQAIVRQIYEMCDGILIPGGGDVNPKIYGQKAKKEVAEVDISVDAAELPIVTGAVLDRKPIFGICRGMQIINVALGGTLHQHLPTDQIDHEISFVKNQPKLLAHTIELHHESHLAKLLGTTHIGVNTQHHQAVDRIASELEVVGIAPDGTIEAAEGRNGLYIIGLQGHPEFLSADDERWQAVFTDFVVHAGEFAKTKGLAQVA